MSTGKGRGRPELGDVDLSDMPGPILQPDPEELERRRTFASTLETPAFLERSTGAGVVKVVRNGPPRTSSPASSVPIAAPQQGASAPSDTAPTAPARPPSLGKLQRKPRAEEPNLTVRLPEYVQQAVRMRAVTEKTTVRLIVLRALRQAGFEIDEADMTDDRGIVAKMRSRHGMES